MGCRANDVGQGESNIKHTSAVWRVIRFECGVCGGDLGCTVCLGFGVLGCGFKVLGFKVYTSGVHLTVNFKCLEHSTTNRIRMVAKSIKMQGVGSGE